MYEYERYYPKVLRGAGVSGEELSPSLYVAYGMK